MLPPTSALTAEIITLRAIALKLDFNRTLRKVDAAAEIITLRAIALKLGLRVRTPIMHQCRDHNATSYSTETVPKGRFTETGCRQQRS